MDGAWRPVMERYIATLLSGEPGSMERIRAESSWRQLAREGAAAATAHSWDAQGHDGKKTNGEVRDHDETGGAH